MSKLNFSDVKSVITYNSKSSNKGYKFPLMPKLNGIIGNLTKGQLHTVSGLPSSGITSFIDQNYVMSVLLQWYNTPENSRNPIKIFYYSMKDTELKKLQLLLCNYIKLVNNLKTDIATLNSQEGKLYSLNKDPALQLAIEDASDFFDEVLNNDILVIKEGQVKPTDIYNDIMTYVENLGSKNEHNEFEYFAEHENLTTLVIVDSIDLLLPDNEGYGIITGNDLDTKFKRQINVLKSRYDITFILSLMSNVGYIRTPKDTEPHYRHLGNYSSITDKGICIYNPINEKNIRFYDGDEDIYTSPRGSVLMRTWHVVRNSDGIESVSDRLLFLPGTSYLVEHSYKNKIEDLDDVLDILVKKTHFYNQ